MNETECRSRIHLFYYLARDVYRAHIQNKYAAFRALIHEHLQLDEIMYGGCFFITDELHVKL